MIINNLYHNELRLYKNFFQPVMKLASKERVGSSIKRKYDTPCKFSMVESRSPEGVPR